VQRAVRAAVARAVDAGALPVVLSGNCNMAALGTLAGLATRNLGIIWFDAHGDFNTPETTIGGFLDGMALAMATGRCWRELLTRLPGFEPIPEANVILFGVRDLDPLEGALLAESHVAVVSSTDVSTSSALLEELRHRVDGLYVHIDLDVLDPTAHGRANEFAVPGGLTLDQLALLLGKMANRFRIRGVGLTSYDPAFDGDGRVSRAALTLLEAVATEAERSTRSGALQGSGQRTTTLLEDE
jgi:arginase